MLQQLFWSVGSRLIIRIEILSHACEASRHLCSCQLRHRSRQQVQVFICSLFIYEAEFSKASAARFCATSKSFPCDLSCRRAQESTAARARPAGSGCAGTGCRSRPCSPRRAAPVFSAKVWQLVHHHHPQNHSKTHMYFISGPNRRHNSAFTSSASVHKCCTVIKRYANRGASHDFGEFL